MIIRKIRNRREKKDGKEASTNLTPRFFAFVHNLKLTTYQAATVFQVTEVSTKREGLEEHVGAG